MQQGFPFYGRVVLQNGREFTQDMLRDRGVLVRIPIPQGFSDATLLKTIAAPDALIGSVVIAESACVAVEAMEGTDATIERAGVLMRSLEGDASTLSRTLTVVKIAKPNQDMRFDVPVIGLKTIEVMHKAGASCLALDAGRCLLLDGAAIIDEADRVGVSIVTE